MSSGQFDFWHLRTTSASILANPAEKKIDDAEDENVVHDEVGDHDNTP